TGQAVVICPGGGYGILAYDWEGTDIAKWLNTHGIAGIVLKYRLPDEASNAIPHQSPLMDARQALLLVRKNSAAWHINPARVGIMGFSAGGHLAATAGTHFSSETRPDFMALIYPVITMKNEFTHQGSRTNLLGSKPDEALIEEFSNERHVTPDTPPTFLVHANDDEAVPVENSLQMYQALRDKGVAAEMHIYSYGGHGFSLATGQGYLATWPDRFIDWLNRIM
ncbi:MAG: alpha/beta hydrolase, partial [Cyclobacteriaceae bacterium]|nr:alpha/beta hydrolase [Cyclobacteriaceae bacterium]